MADSGAEFRVLGPVEVVVGGRPVDLSAKERAVIAALALDAGRVVSVDRLVDAVWGGEAPETANVSLRVHVSRLRKALTEAGIHDRVVTRDPGYLLAVQVEDGLDLTRFDQLVRAGRAALDAGRAEEAARVLGDAVALHRGEALRDLADAGFAHGEATRLQEGRLAALEAKVDAELACGRHREVIGELDTLCREHPLRERFWAQRMTALYRAGRQAEALRAYQDLRVHLADELGLEPSPELARLEADVLAQAPDLAVMRPAPSEPPPTLPSGVVTFLLTDIEGSTGLWDAQPAAMAIALERHDQVVAQVVAGHGGVVLKAKGEGDATVSVFRRASDGVAAALELQRAVGQEAWAPEATIVVRASVHTGEAHERDGDYFGPTLNRAARIRALAGGGEVLVSQAAAELVHDRLPDGAALVPLGPHRLAGVSRPEAVFALLGPGLAEGVSGTTGAPLVPLPPVLVEPAGAFVGRSAELGAIEAVWARAEAGERDALLVAGEPGIGKTSLVARAARMIHDRGGVVLFGHCDEESLVPFQPFVEALAHWVVSKPVGDLRAVLGAQAADLALLVPELRQRLAGIAESTGAETERYRLFEAVPALVKSIAAAAPVLIVLDDLHWADRPTLQLLVHVIRRTAGTRLLVLGTYRDTDLVRSHPMAETLVELRRANVVQRLALRGLSREDVVALVCGDSRNRDSADVALAEALWSETEGSPLFLRESLRHLEESEAIAPNGEGGWRARRPIGQLGIPEGVKEVIGRRLTRLSDAANLALRTASVMGREFPAGLVAHVNGTPLDDVIDALDEAGAAGVVAESAGAGALGRYSFTHALVREALYDELSITRRVRMHQRVGEAIEALHSASIDDHLGELAYHYSQAAVGGLADKAIDYGRRAGDAALAGVAYEEAARLYGLALEVADDAAAAFDVQCDLLLARGAAEWRASDHTTARSTFARAADLARTGDDPVRLARAALGHAGAAIRWIWVQAGTVDERGIALLEEALDRIGPDDSTWRARLLAALGSELHMEPTSGDRPDRLTADALALARRVDDRPTLAYVLSARNIAILGPGTARERLANADEALALAEELDDDALRGFAHGHRSIAFLDLDDIPAVRAAQDAVRTFAHRTKDAGLFALAGHGLGVLAGLEGRLDEAQRLHNEAFLGAQEARDPNALLQLAAPMIDLLRVQGRLREIVFTFDAAQEAFPFGGQTRDAALTWVQSESGVPCTHSLAEIGPDAWCPPVIELWALAGLARVAFIHSDADGARWLYDRLLPHAALNATIGGIGCFGAVSQSLGLLAGVLGRPDEAVRWFDDALARYRRNGWAVLEAEATVQCADALVTLGDPARATVLLGAGEAMASSLDLRPVRVAATRVQARLDRRVDAPTAAKVHVSGRDRLRGKLSTRGRKVMARVVGRAGDDDLVRRFGSPLAQRALFSAMARSFQPAMAFGFEGDLSFEVRVEDEATGAFTAEWWTIEVRGKRATARPGRSTDPAVTARLELVDLLRMASGEPPADAMLAGRLELSGDVMRFVHALAMFGGVEPSETLEEVAPSSSG